MESQIKILFIFCILFIVACQNKYFIQISGQITDELTGKPIANAEVLIHCWYSLLDDDNLEKETVFTDENGMYYAYFNRGNRVNVASKAIHYNPVRSFENENNFYHINLRLSKETPNPTLTKNLLRSVYQPYLKLKIFGKKNSSELDLENIETDGYDCISHLTTDDTLNCDIWFKIEKKEGFPHTLIANQNGGIIPIYKKDIKSSFLFEMPIAPRTGYKKECRIKELEGLFVLCRDGKTFAKIIFDDVEFSEGKGTTNHYWEEYKKQFSCLYQPNGTTNLSFSKPDISLEQFLGKYNHD